MRRMLLALAAMMLAASSADAQTVRWQGFFQFESSRGDCFDYDPTGGGGIVRFRPQLAGTDNGSGTKFSVYGRHFAESYRLPNGKFSNQFKVVETMQMGDSFGPIEHDVSVRFMEVIPSNFNVDTPFIQIVGEIKGYDTMPECIARFRMSLTRRIDG